jgi:hypothetical protein
MLMIANRYEWKPAIAGALAAGTIVVADRYLASSVAYGEAQGLDPDWLFEAQRYLPRPALTIMIDIAPATAVARKRTERDRFEQDLPMLERVRSSYRRQAGQPGWVAVDGARRQRSRGCKRPHFARPQPFHRLRALPQGGAGRHHVVHQHHACPAKRLTLPPQPAHQPRPGGSPARPERRANVQAPLRQREPELGPC